MPHQMTQFKVISAAIFLTDKNKHHYQTPVQTYTAPVTTFGGVSLLVTS